MAYRALSWTLAAFNLFVFAGCGGGESSPGNGGANTGGSGGRVTSAEGGRTGGAPATGGHTASGGAVGSSGSGGSGGSNEEASGGTSSGGGPSSGGAAPGGEGGEGDAGAGGPSGGGAGGSPACQTSSQTRSSRTARSAGFTGTYTQNYAPLYNVSCTGLSECLTACVAAGGTQTSCGASECVHSVTDYCLPPTYWFDLDGLLIEASSIESSAWMTLVNNPYRDQLIATNFQFEIPAGAQVRGISFSINESADFPDVVGDYNVRAWLNGVAVGLDRAHTVAWTASFHYENYGGAQDLWGTSWTADDVNSADFGVALTPMYLESAGNARAYVDFIRATVSYSVCD